MSKRQDAALIEYARRFLKVAARESEPTAITLEQVVAFAKQLRAGCQQDLERLILRCIDETANHYGKESLRDLGIAIHGEGYGSWGLPDCRCAKTDCVYCSTGMAVRSLGELADAATTV